MEEDSVSGNAFDYDNYDNKYIATEQEIRDCKVDIISGEKENSFWLILDNKYILIKNRPFKNGKAVWECRGRRHYDCPFRMEVIVEEETMSIVWMYKVGTHTCPQQEVDVWVHRFKVWVKEGMRSDFRVKYNTLYYATKKRVLESVEDEEMRKMVSYELPAVVNIPHIPRRDGGRGEVEILIEINFKIPCFFKHTYSTL